MPTEENLQKYIDAGGLTAEDAANRKAEVTNLLSKARANGQISKIRSIQQPSGADQAHENCLAPTARLRFKVCSSKLIQI